MRAQIEFNTTQFRATLKRYIETTSKSMAQALNSKAYDLAWHAEKFTKRASRAAIEGLGVVGHKLRRSRKTGQLGKGAAILKENSRARAIVVANMRKVHGPMSPKEIDKQARQLVAKRLRAVGYLASGWLPAIRRLFRLSDIKRGRPNSTKRAGTSGTGKAIPATKQRLVATIENDLDALENAIVLQKAEVALTKAATFVQRDMEEYLLKKMKRAAKSEGIEVH